MEYAIVPVDLAPCIVCVTADMLPGPAPALSDHLRPQVRAHRPTDNVRKMLQIIFENHPHDLWIWEALWTDFYCPHGYSQN